MTDALTSIESRVVRVVAEALDVDPERVRPHSSLIDDLGAESIDFLDILFRIETDFGLKIQENDMWRGSIDGDDPDSIKTAVARLKARMPDFGWDRFPSTPTKADLPRLITVQTIVDYLRARQAEDSGPVQGVNG